MTKLVPPLISKPNYNDFLIGENGLATRVFQTFLDETQEKINAALLGPQVQLTGYLVADLPDASRAGGWIYVEDETGGAVPAFSDGTNWRRCTDRAVVS